MDQHEDFQKRIRAKINQVEAKLTYLKDGDNQLSKAFHEFAEEIDEYLEYQIQTNKSFEKRLDHLENQ